MELTAGARNSVQNTLGAKNAFRAIDPILSDGNKKISRFTPGFWKNDDNFIKELVPFCKKGEDGKIASLPTYPQLDQEGRSDLRNAIKRRKLRNVIALLGAAGHLSESFEAPQQAGKQAPAFKPGYWEDWNNFRFRLLLECELDVNGKIARLPGRKKIIDEKLHGLKHGIQEHGGIYNVVKRLKEEKMLSKKFVPTKKERNNQRAY